MRLLDRGLLPDAVVCAGIRRIVSARLREQEAGGIAAAVGRLQRAARAFGSGPIAVEADTANAQHYEVPAAFFERVLGPHLKYSARGGRGRADARRSGRMNAGAHGANGPGSPMASGSSNSGADGDR